MIIKTKRAFSLIELMVSLIIISVIVAAFAPVMTKKLQKGKVAISHAKNLITKECAGIDADCKLCSSPATGDEPKCLSCAKNCAGAYYLNKTTCKCQTCASIDPYCTACIDGGCLQCRQGYFLYNKKCYKCPTGCTDCFTYGVGDMNLYDEPVKCTSCAVGYYLDAIGKCKTCKSYSADEARCLECRPTSAGQLQNAFQCTKYNCADGYYGSGCQTCDKFRCIVCNGYKDRVEKCHACHSNCKTCIGPLYSDCLSCWGNYQLKNGTCCGPSAANGCSKCYSDGRCTACENNKYFLDSGSSSCKGCSAGVPGCFECSKDSSGVLSCSACYAGYYEYRGHCEACGAKNCNLCEGLNGEKCVICNPGYYVQSGTCYSCSSRFQYCLECNEYACTKCKSGKFLDELGRCLSL